MSTLYWLPTFLAAASTFSYIPGYFTKTFGFIKSLSGYCSGSIFPSLTLLYICESAFLKIDVIKVITKSTARAIPPIIKPILISLPLILIFAATLATPSISLLAFFTVSIYSSPPPAANFDLTTALSNGEAKLPILFFRAFLAFLFLFFSTASLNFDENPLSSNFRIACFFR